jgi:hypothetical protein
MIELIQPLSAHPLCSKGSAIARPINSIMNPL